MLVEPIGEYQPRDIGVSVHFDVARKNCSRPDMSPNLQHHLEGRLDL